eukprot:1161769-Pelagomonas_calceolata.AAC.11
MAELYKRSATKNSQVVNKVCAFNESCWDAGTAPASIFSLACIYPASVPSHCWQGRANKSDVCPCQQPRSC